MCHVHHVLLLLDPGRGVFPFASCLTCTSYLLSLALVDSHLQIASSAPILNCLNHLVLLILLQLRIHRQTEDLTRCVFGL